MTALLDCAREENITLLQAHRAGSWPGLAENSIAAIEASLGAGAVFLELDVARTADGVLVLMHDDTVDRTTNGTGSIAAKSWSELSMLRLVDESGELTEASIPRLRHALGVIEGRGFAQIDRKPSVSFDELASVLLSRDVSGRVMIITYSLGEARTVHELMPDVLISLQMTSLDDLADAEKAGVPRDRIVAWLGVGSGNPALDALLGNLGIETSYGDFGAEREGSADYVQMAANGAEIISVDKVGTASKALGAIEALATLGENCDLGTGPRPQFRAD